MSWSGLRTLFTASTKAASIFAAAITGSCPAPSGGGGRILPLERRERALERGVEHLEDARDDCLEEGREIPIFSTLFL